jgi:hypothetical protein
MRAHDAINIIPILFDLVEESRCKPTFTVVAMDD